MAIEFNSGDSVEAIRYVPDGFTATGDCTSGETRATLIGASELDKLREQAALVPELVEALEYQVDQHGCYCDDSIWHVCEGHQLLNKARAVLGEDTD